MIDKRYKLIKLQSLLSAVSILHRNPRYRAQTVMVKNNENWHRMHQNTQIATKT